MASPSIPKTAEGLPRFLKRSMFFSYLLLGGGVLLLGWIVYRLGPATIGGYLKILGWKIVPLLLLSFLFYFFFTQAWNEFLKAIRVRVPFGRLFMIKVAGEAVNVATPFNWGGGDPVRIYLLKKSIPVAEGTASVVVDRTLFSMGMLLFMLIGIVIAFLKFKLSPALRWGFPLSLLFMIGMTLYWYRRQHEGIFAFLVHCLQRLRIKRHWSFETLQKLKEIDELITRFYTQHRKGFWTAFLLQFIVRILGVLEVYLAVILLGNPLTWVTCYLLMSVTVIINLIFAFIPGGVGVLEGSYAGIFHLLKLDPALGTSLQIFRRIRMTLWMAVGLFYIYHLDRKTRLQLETVAFEHHPLEQMELPPASRQDLS